MLKPISLDILAQRYGGVAINGAHLFHQVSTDTRTLARGDLFVALEGDRFDAHDYLSQALDRGAKGLVVDQKYKQKLPAAAGHAVWMVSDTTVALGFISHYQRQYFQYPLIAITGSSGKTTVKGMLREILSVSAGSDRVFATRGNYNNHIGVPLSLLQLNQSHRYAVIEMGASGPNDIAYLTDIANPNVAVINNVMASHVEGFGSIDAIAKGKGEIYKQLGDQACAVINASDHYAKQWLLQNRRRKVIAFSTSMKNISIENIYCDVRAERAEKQKNGCYTFSLICGRQSTFVKLSVLGSHNIANAIAAAACAHALDVDVESIAEGLKNFEGEPGRLQISLGIGGAILIDDTYNANPGSMKAAIDVLASMPVKKILVMGDMAELGSRDIQEHEAIGRYVAEKNIDYFFSVGEFSQYANAAVVANNTSVEVNHYSDCDDLSEYLRGWLNQRINQSMSSDYAILVKGSRSSKMERIIRAIQIEGENDASVAC